MKQIILASASPRRRELLQQAGCTFTVKISEVEEVVTKQDPAEVVEELALQKAVAVSALEGAGALVLGADTVVAAGGEILGKPKDREDAARMLRLLQGRTHQVYTGVALVEKQEEGEMCCSFSEKTDVTMYPMSEEEIYAYIDTTEPMDKAGAYGIQGRAAIYIREIAGDYNNVVGLPIARIYQEWKEKIFN